MYLFPRIETQFSKIKGDGLLFFIVSNSNEANRDNFNQSNILGYANVIVSENIAEIIELQSENNNYRIQEHLLRYIFNFFLLKILKIKIDLANPNWKSNIDFYINLGFANPEKNIDETMSLTLVDKINIEETSIQLNNLISSLVSKKCKLKIYFGKTLANTLASYLKKPYEVAGKIFIGRYENGIGILGFNTETLIKGDQQNFVVALPENAPISFHTHPDICYKEFGCFLGWPSGPDMRSIPYKYLQNDDILVHFVISSEGIWLIHPTVQFQQLMRSLKQASDETCGFSLLESILNTFTFFEQGRQYELVQPTERHVVKKQFLKIAKHFKISDLASNIPELQQYCSQYITKDALLFNVDIIKWKKFSTDEGVNLSFDYIPDPEGGLSCFIPINLSLILSQMTNDF